MTVVDPRVPIVRPAHAQPIPAPPPRTVALPLPLERGALLAFLVGWVAWIAAIGWLWTNHPGLHHGDSFSDAFHLIAVRNYLEHGFGQHMGLPQGACFLPDPGTQAPYVSFPPGPYWLLYVFQCAGLTELWQMRAAVVVLSGLAALLYMALAARLAGSWLVGALAGFFYMCSAPFVEYADSFCYHAYAQLTLAATLLAWLAYERARSASARAAWLTATAILFFLDGWLTFEHMAFVPLFAGLRWLIQRERRLFLATLLMGLVPVLVIGTRIAHNSLALGGLDQALAQMRGRIVERSGVQNLQKTYAALLDNWQRRLGHGALPPDHYDYPFRYPLLGTPVLIVGGLLITVLLCSWHQPLLAAVRRGLGAVLILSIAASAWFLLMVQHAAVHRHLVVLLMPAGALLLGSLAAAGVLQSVANRPARPPIAWLGPLLALALAAAFAFELRTSFAANQAFVLDSAARRQLDAIRKGQDQLRTFAEQATGMHHVVIRRYYPELSVLLDRYFEFSTDDRVPDLASDSVYWVQYWGGDDRSAVLAALARFGLPDMFSPGNPFLCMHMLFRGGSSLPDAPVATFEGGVSIRALRLVETLDRAGWLLQAVVEGPLETLDCRDLTLYCHVLNPAGEVARYGDVRLSWGVHDNQRAFVWSLIPREIVPPGARLKLGLWCPTGAERSNYIVPLDGTAMGLPGELETAPSQEHFLWTPPMLR